MNDDDCQLISIITESAGISSAGAYSILTDNEKVCMM